MTFEESRDGLTTRLSHDDLPSFFDIYNSFLPKLERHSKNHDYANVSRIEGILASQFSDLFLPILDDLGVNYGKNKIHFCFNPALYKDHFELDCEGIIENKMRREGERKFALNPKIECAVEADVMIVTSKLCAPYALWYHHVFSSMRLVYPSSSADSNSLVVSCGLDNFTAAPLSSFVSVMSKFEEFEKLMHPHRDDLELAYKNYCHAGHSCCTSHEIPAEIGGIVKEALHWRYVHALFKACNRDMP